MAKKKSIVCFGEVLWDVFPTHKVAGGAPMNVAFHANNFGMDATVISAIGNDALGTALLSFLVEKGMNTDLIHIDYTNPTSTVQVTLNEEGSASYEIVEPVAWDFLNTNESIENAVANADLFLFGSLICRSERNLEALLQLNEKAKNTVFDVNLRLPFYKQSVVEDLMQRAEVVKMNEEELDQIIGWYNQHAILKDQMAFLMHKFDIKTLIMTAGKAGAYCMHNNQLYSQEGFPIQIKDTVGSGDSFLAAFLFKMLNKASWQECLAFACATGALVATKSGGTPNINESLVKALIEKSRNILAKS